MIGHAAGLRRLDGIIWAIIAVLAVIMLTAPVVSNFRLVGHSFLAAGGATALCLAGFWLYETRRPDPRLASALGGTAQIVTFAAVGAPVSYIATSLDLPLRDGWFAATDRALGLDWSALLNWMDAHASVHPVFSAIYSSLMPQTVVVVLALAMTGRFVWLRMFVLAFIISTIVTIVIAAFVPAEGVWGFHKLSAASHPHIVPATREMHLHVFHGLRDGSFRQLMAMGADGIVTFPSLHTALALIITVALWPIPVLRWIGLAINTLMLVSIPVDGGHYFIDMLAGLAIAWVSVVAAKRIAEFAHQPKPQTANSRVGLIPG
jgi:membrane-associated phospholipid phosphatase